MIPVSLIENISMMADTIEADIAVTGLMINLFNVRITSFGSYFILSLIFYRIPPEAIGMFKCSAHMIRTSGGIDNTRSAKRKKLWGRKLIDELFDQLLFYIDIEAQHTDKRKELKKFLIFFCFRKGTF